jgi:hypothetical protein
MADVERIKPALPTLPPIGRGGGAPGRPPPQPRKPTPKPKPKPGSPARHDDDPSSDHIDEYA